MRRRFVDQGGLFSYVNPESRIAAGHPLRKIRGLVREALRALNGTFARLYSGHGRPGTAPEQLLGALLLQVLYGIRSERQLMEQLDYNLLYRKAHGREAKLSYMGHAVMETRHGLAVDGKVTQANGTAERRASEAMLKRRRKAGSITVGEDKAYDSADHVDALRAMNVPRTRRGTIPRDAARSTLGRRAMPAMARRSLAAR
jgi:transposase